MKSTNHTAPAAGQPLKDITFGIELEFVAMIPKKHRGSGSKVSKRVRKYAQDCLAKTKVKLPCTKKDCPTKEHEWFLPIFAPGAQVAEDNWDAWELERDGSVSLEAGMELGSASWNTMELVSRILNFDRPTQCPFGQTYPCAPTEVLEWHWADEISSMLEVLRQSFAKPGYRAYTNCTTGLHLHLANGNDTISVQASKGLAGTMTALERCFDEIMPTTRISGYNDISLETRYQTHPGLDTDGFTYGHRPREDAFDWSDFRSRHYMAISNFMIDNVDADVSAELRKRISDSDALSANNSHDDTALRQLLTSYNVPAWLRMLRKQPGHVELRDLGLGHHRCALNLDGLVPRFETRNTAEVRLHYGSLDSGEIFAWIDLIVNITRWADTTEPDTLFSYIENAWSTRGYTIVDLAREVDANDSTIAHYASVLRGDHAIRRYQAATSEDRNPKDNLHHIFNRLEQERFEEFNREKVSEKIRFKVESGRYGQLPTTTLKPEFSTDACRCDRFKHMCFDEDQEAWIDFKIEQGPPVRDTDDDDEIGDAEGFIDDYAGPPKDEKNSANGNGDDAAPNGKDKDKVCTCGNFSDKDDGDDYDDEYYATGYFGIHHTLAVAMDDVAGESLAHLEDYALNMPDSSKAGESNDDDNIVVDDKGNSIVCTCGDFDEDGDDDDADADYSDEYYATGYFGVHPSLALALDRAAGKSLVHLEEYALNMSV